MSSEKSPIYPRVKLPHPFLTEYSVHTVGSQITRRVLKLENQPPIGRPLTEPLHLDSLSWTDLSIPDKSQSPPESNNSAWARAQRSPSTIFEWTAETPSLGQIWNITHAIYLGNPTHEYFRLTLIGRGSNIIRQELLTTGLAIEHPRPWYQSTENVEWHSEQLLVLRSAFWQGAASPTGPQPIWSIGDGTDGPLRKPLHQFPIMPENYQITMKFPDEPVYTRHPTRRPKPHPGSIAYSRYIPEVDQHFSLEVVDWENDEHLGLFNTWQNDPRVSKGWNETGTLDEHRNYLRKLHFDPHVLCLFGRFDNTRFSYFELYWAKVGVDDLLTAKKTSTHG